MLKHNLRDYGTWEILVNSERSLETVPVIPLGEFILRPLRTSDAVAWFDYLRDRRTTEHTSWPEVSEPMIAGLIDRLLKEYAARVSLRWAIARTSDDELVGTCGFTRFDAERVVGELAYDLAPDHWRRGIMRAAVNAAVSWGFAAGGLQRVEAFVMVTNDPSAALLARCGFARERFVPRFRIARGTPRDFWCYGKERHAVETPADG